MKSYLPEQRSDYSVLRSKLLRFRHFNVTGSTTTTLSSLTNLTYLHVRIGYKPRIRPFEAFTLSNDRSIYSVKRPCYNNCAYLRQVIFPCLDFVFISVFVEKKRALSSVIVSSWLQTRLKKWLKHASNVVVHIQSQQSH